MPTYDAFNGLPVEVSDDHASRWKARLVKAVFAILVLGLVLTAILWVVVSHEVGALVLSVVFAACSGLLVLRQTLLAERG